MGMGNLIICCFSLEAGARCGEIYQESKYADLGVSAHAFIIPETSCTPCCSTLLLAINGGG
jgi:hypothetical protein